MASEAVGDVTGWIEDRGLGVTIDHDDVEGAARSVVKFLCSDDFRSGTAGARCLEFAAAEMDMLRTVEDYGTIYEDLDTR